MTNEELKAAWAANIDSHEKFHEVFGRTRGYLPRTWQNWAYLVPQRDSTHMPSLSHEAEDVWPLQRDMIREAIGFYPEATSVLKWMRSVNSNVGLGQMFPHVSPVNREEIAFSPDANQAKADRKQRMSVGRFLRKFLLFLSDREIQRLDQQHRSELDTSFELAETVEAIERVYVGMDGDSGCMRYDKSNFSHSDYHPSAVYASPGMGVAYTADSNGTVKSRSVVWVNPDDAEDKRFVRVYGDPILKKKLLAQGYKQFGLAGAKLRIYKDSAFIKDSMMVMPWIDPSGGIHDSGADRSRDAEHAVRFTGEDFITLIHKSKVAAYQRAGIYPVEVQTQNGHVEVPEVDIGTFQFECAVTGKSTNRMDIASVPWIMEDGTVRMARADAVGDLSPPSGNLHIFREGRLQRAYCLQATREAWGIPGYTSHFNDEATREAAGLAMLDKAFYPDSERYHTRSDCVYMTGADGERRYIKAADALMLYKEGDDTFIHIDMVKAMKAEGCVPIAVLNGYRGLAHKDYDRIVTTRGGKRVIKSRHDVMQLWDGTWEYSRNTVSFAVGGLTMTIGKTDVAAKIVIPKERVLQHYTPHYQRAYRNGTEDDRAYRDRLMLRDMGRGFQGAQTFIKSGETIVACDYYNKATEPARFYEAALGILAMQEDTEWMRRTLGYNWQQAVPWARVVKDAYEGMKEFDREREMAMAEANAVEAAPSTKAVIEVLNTLDDSGMDKLIAEVDDTLATAVVRRWPRLSGSPDGMGPQRIEPPVLPTVTQEDGTVRAVADDSWVPAAMAAVEAALPEPNFTLVETNADDDLLAQLRHAGLAPIVIDEHTVFPTPEQV